MKRLYLLRHAKAERDAPSGEDFDRALAERGLRDAETLGRFLNARDWRPDLIVASPARRTMQTVDRLTASWPKPVSVVEDKSLYLASATRLLARLHATPDSAASVMFVGHNPGLEDFAIQLAHGVASDALRRMQRNFPTCALAVFDLSIDRWGRAAPDLSRLDSYFGPKDLADGGRA